MVQKNTIRKGCGGENSKFDRLLYFFALIFLPSDENLQWIYESDIRCCIYLYDKSWPRHSQLCFRGFNIAMNATGCRATEWIWNIKLVQRSSTDRTMPNWSPVTQTIIKPVTSSRVWRAGQVFKQVPQRKILERGTEERHGLGKCWFIKIYESGVPHLKQKDMKSI
jgi:hypothetical protein